MINKTEQEIMEKWGGVMTVSITCVAYNHEEFIETTLDSFLMQETSFPFEILINDDVSTDKTVEILKAYEEKFPNIVKPLYQSENQYSKGINTMALLFPHITGKYVAFCDGDDYWIDKEKLQIQVDAMEEHPELDLCFHPSYRDVNGKRTEVLARHAKKDTKFTVQHSIAGHGDFAETASLMFTRTLIDSLPEWFLTASPGDYVSEVMGAVRGGSLYIDRIMSVYRSGLAEGWTEQEMKKTTEERKQSLINIIEQLEFLDQYLDFEFTSDFKRVIHKDIFGFITSVNNDIAIKKELYKEHQVNFTLIEKIKWHLLFKHQNLIEVLKTIKIKLKSQSDVFRIGTQKIG